MSLILNMDLDSSEGRKFGGFQCQEGHFVKLGNNFVKGLIRPVTQETPVVAEKKAVKDLRISITDYGLRVNACW